jgi:sialate O-acetylesterase
MLILLCAALLQQPLTLPSIFGDNMVLQRQQPVPFFGHAAPGDKIRISIGSRFVETSAGPDGRWQASFRPMEAGGPYKVVVQGRQTVSFDNVMVGEVWLASGQSNMEWRQADADDHELARQEADPHVRMFTVERTSTESPAPDVNGEWIVSRSDTVPNFSAVANAFAKDLRKALGVPVGIIHSSWGGTPAEAWTGRDAMTSHPQLGDMVKTYLAGLKDFDERKRAHDRAMAEWNAAVYKKDPGNKGVLQGFADFSHDTSDWRTVRLPNLIEVTERQDIDGAVWYRKTLDMPDAWFGKAVILELGPIDDFDDTYVNGRRVGRTDGTTRWWYAAPRRYRIAPGILRRGQNVLAVRVFDQSGRGGFTGSPDAMRWYPEDGTSLPANIAGEWLSKVEVKFTPPSREILQNQPQAPFGPGHPWAPGGLYNGMIAPLAPYGLRGAIWYQGESNAGRAEQYRTLFPAMIQDWRRTWNNPQFAFHFVQLANFTARLPEPADSDWAELREAQMAALSLPRTGFAMAIDIGDANDIHPRNKREVGRRLALSALAKTYGQSITYSGPVFESVRLDGATARVRFRHAQGLRTSDGRPPTGFSIAGDDRRFVWAKAHIQGDEIVLQNPTGAPVAGIRYGWANNPGVNVVNGAGLPMSPFRTDNWTRRP